MAHPDVRNPSLDDLREFIEMVNPLLIKFLGVMEANFYFPKDFLPIPYEEVLSVYRNEFLVRKGSIVLALEKAQALLPLVPEDAKGDFAQVQNEIKGILEKFAKDAQEISFKFSPSSHPTVTANTFFKWFREALKPKMERVMQLFGHFNLLLKNCLPQGGEFGRETEVLLSRFRVEELLADLAVIASNPHYPRPTVANIEGLQYRKAIFENYKALSNGFESRLRQISDEDIELFESQMDELENLFEAFKARLNSADDFPSQQELDVFTVTVEGLIAEIERKLAARTKN